MLRFSIKTSKRNDFIDITSKVESFIKDSEVDSGVLQLFVPHTTCAITVNEGFDPDVLYDIDNFLQKNIPVNGTYRHFEGNSDSHIKTSLIGVSESLIFEDNTIQFGTWQKVIFCEFDGPRERFVYGKIIGG